VNAPELAQFRTLLDSGDFVSAVLIEPLPNHAAALAQRWPPPKTKVIQAACSTDDKPVTLHLSDQGSFTDDVKRSAAPTIIYGFAEPVGTLVVPGIRFSTVDPGNLDAIAIDVEGCEWMVLSDMVSRPDLIVIETHCVGKVGIHHDIDNILDWMYHHWYRLVNVDQADMVFRRKEE